MEEAKKLKNIRINGHLKQKEAAKLLRVPFRTYCRYESEEKYVGTLKYDAMVDRLQDIVRVDEEHGVLTLDTIKDAVLTCLSGSNVKVCVLFGPYALGKAKANSQVNLIVSGAPSGVRLYDLLARLEDALHKKVDLIRLEAATQNTALLERVLIEGIKIFG